MHRQIYWDFERPTVKKKKSLEWLGSSGLKAETEGLIILVQNQDSTCVIRGTSRSNR
jgi:hypothetical protein